ncbi:hypothetical protein EIZ47_10925 [Chryseobacterium lacus]|uniref:Uncharacterized protein n=1 Tax=Chryseobacterium lacus TaxID=2058346 RepID=A0A368MYM6_9FLAO|nr:hypothetical protein [Chryseobacterium lacus]RCU42099.1 hypothetical protein DQ356_11050 [Chryseobacterium lacus]RST26215.1 hypothetical protein EIZ47_10925 [Chryseobacterium lacus]
MNFKEQLFYRLWKEKDKTTFEHWIYNSNAIDFEECVGEKSYLEIISENFSGLTIRQLKQLVFDNLSPRLKEEFKTYIRTNQKAIKATCIKTVGIDYNGKSERNWELKVGNEYYILGISVDLKKSANQIGFQIFDPSYSETTPYFIPAELFEINGKIVPPNYSITVKDNTLQLDPMEFVDKTYAAVEYSFWEDYFDDHEKAVKIFKATIERLDIELDAEEYGE